MRTVRLASLLIVAVVLNTACEKTGDSPGGKGDTAAPYGGAGVNGSVGSTPGYLNAAGIDKNPNKGAVAPAAAAADTSAKSAGAEPAAPTPAPVKP